MSYTPKNPNGQDTMSDSSPVVIASDQSAVPVTVSGVATAANQTTGNTSLATIAGAVAGTEVQVDVLTMPTVTVTATNLDVQSGGADLATSAQGAAIQTAVEILDNAISGSEMQVDVVGALPAGNNNIGDVDIASSVLPSGASTSANQTTIIGHLDGVEALLTTIDADTSNLSAANQVEDAAYTSAQPLSMMGTVRRDADTGIVGTTGDVAPLLTDELGYLKVSTHPASITAYTDNITVNGDTVALDVSRYSNLTIYCSGTFATVNVTFEGSIDGGTLWFGVQGVRTNSNVVEGTTGNLSAAPAYAWELSVNALTNFRVRATAYGSGTQVWRFQPGTYATEPIPAIQAHAVTVASGGIASGAIASGAIAAGAIAAGATAIAANEDDASAAGDRLVKVAQMRLDTPVSGANLSASGDYTQVIADSFGKTWVTGTYAEDIAHVAGEAIAGNGARRIDTPASSAGTSGDWATVDASAEGALWVTGTPTTTGGLTAMNATSSDGATALTNSAQVIKATAGNLYGYYIYNPNAASAAFVQFYNTAAASVTVGTTNPLFMLTIPAGAAANLMFPYPVSFSNAGWSWAATSTAGGNGALGTALDAVAFYK